VEQDVKAAAAGVFDRAARDYEPAGVDFFNRMGRRLVELARVAAGERVLDLGCGRGASLFPAAAAVGPTGAVLGLDLAPMMVELTAADARDLPHVQVRLGDADDPDVPPESYDVVLAGQVIFLLPSVVAALRRWARLLRPGGRIAFSSFAPRDPVAEGVMKAIAPLVAGGPAPRGVSTAEVPDPDAIARTVAAAGLELAGITSETFRTSFADADAWWDWSWTHGARAVLERIPADRLDEARAIATEALTPARTDRGDHVIATAVNYTLTHRSAAGRSHPK
jgi:ubiquinone/menaquinone biosynthesis C-methylase UbiE